MKVGVSATNLLVVPPGLGTRLRVQRTNPFCDGRIGLFDVHLSLGAVHPANPIAGKMFLTKLLITLTRNAFPTIPRKSALLTHGGRVYRLVCRPCRRSISRAFRRRPRLNTQNAWAWHRRRVRQGLQSNFMFGFLKPFSRSATQGPSMSLP